MSHIKLVTEIPGPRSRRCWPTTRYVARALALGFPAAVQKAEGALLTDVDGNRFIDLAGGGGRLTWGTRTRKSSKRPESRTSFVHTDYTVAPYALYSELAGRLAGLVPGGEKAAFFNSGSEAAVENAIKMSRVYTGRKAVILLRGGFTGAPGWPSR